MATPKLVQKRVSDSSLGLDYMSLSDAIALLVKKRKEAARAGFSDLEIQFDRDAYSDSEREYPYLYGKRMETMEEAEKREAAEAERKAADEAHKRTQYEALRKQFEGNVKVSYQGRVRDYRDADHLATVMGLTQPISDEAREQLRRAERAGRTMYADIDPYAAEMSTGEAVSARYLVLCNSEEELIKLLGILQAEI